MVSLIYGLGQVAQKRHIPAHIKDERLDKIYLCHPLDDDKGKVIFKKWAKKSFKIHFISSSEINTIVYDIVSICTPPFNHFDAIKLLSSATEKILCEKPLCMPEQIEDFRSFVNNISTEVRPVENFRFTQPYMEILDHARNSSIVRVDSLQLSSLVRRAPKWHRDLPGGLFYDESPHLIYLTQHLLDTQGLESASFKSYDDPDHFQFNMKLESERANSINMWFGAPLNEWFFVVTFEDKIIIYDIFRKLSVSVKGEIKRSVITVFKIFFVFGWSIISAGLRRIAERITRGNSLFGHDVILSNYLGDTYDANVDSGLLTVETMRDVLQRTDNLS